MEFTLLRCKANYAYVSSRLMHHTKDGILQELISIWMQLCSVVYFSVIKIRISAISSAVSSAADCTNSNFDDREMGNWTELHSYWNYLLQNTIIINVGNSELRNFGMINTTIYGNFQMLHKSFFTTIILKSLKLIWTLNSQ